MSPCVFTLARLTLQKTLWESITIRRHLHSSVGNISRVYPEGTVALRNYFEDDLKTFCHMGIKFLQWLTLLELCSRAGARRCIVKRPLLSYVAEEMLHGTEKPVNSASVHTMVAIVDPEVPSVFVTVEFSS